MALSKLKVDEEKLEKIIEILRKMKKIIETTWLRDPKSNVAEAEEFQALRKEIEDMGMYVSYKTEIILDDPLNLKLHAEVNAWKPKNITIQ